uniref:Uncharacterized protein n=1 Tax=Anguilla anguilla TaxID=7936 RepID=A0A0E9SPS5_ANGAN
MQHAFMAMCRQFLHVDTAFY